MAFAASTFPVSAALLAGGNSRRMGEDKARLMVDGVALWERQLATLKATGATEILVSGPVDGAYRACGFPIVNDDTPGLGPLGGVVALLQRAACDLVLVLAIDLPQMPAAYLSALMQEAARTRRGVVPGKNGLFEPLAAVYPRRCLAVAEAQLQGADRSMQQFVRTALSGGLIAERRVAPGEERFFLNVNSPHERTLLTQENPLDISTAT